MLTPITTPGILVGTGDGTPVGAGDVGRGDGSWVGALTAKPPQIQPVHAQPSIVSMDAQVISSWWPPPHAQH